MMLRDAQRNNALIGTALFAALAVSMIIINALVRGIVFTIRAGARAIIRKGKN